MSWPENDDRTPLFYYTDDELIAEFYSRMNHVFGAYKKDTARGEMIGLMVHDKSVEDLIDFPVITSEVNLLRETLMMYEEIKFNPNIQKISKEDLP